MPDYTPDEPMTVKGRYTALEQNRMPYLTRAREAARLTIPALMPPEGSNGSTILPAPFQSTGSRGLTNLSAKLMLALFPPGSAFFKLSLDEKTKQELQAASQGTDIVGETERALSATERRILDAFEQNGARVALNDGMEQLLASGNDLLYINPQGSALSYRLDRYVVKRDAETNVLEIILKECFSRASLPENVRAIVEAHKELHPDQYKSSSYQDSIEVYTRIWRKGRVWYEAQEVCGIEIPDSRSTFPLDASPWLPLALNLIPGEDYGRGFVEQNLGDLYSLEGLRQSIVEFAAQAAKIVWLINPGGVTDPDELAKAPSGKVMEGRKADVEALMLEKFADFQVAAATADKIEQALGEAFLLGSAARRDAERVTAEEIRLIAGELEQSLGGIYSVLTQTLQLPLVKRYMVILQRTHALPPLPKDIIKPQIVTGLAALGRNADMQKLDAFAAGLSELFGPEAVAERLSFNGYATRKAAALGIDTDGLLRSEQEVQAERAQKMRAELANTAAPALVKAQSDQTLAAQAATPQEGVNG
jgi:Bacteriophage head to tail connecting protein.